MPANPAMSRFAGAVVEILGDDSKFLRMLDKDKAKFKKWGVEITHAATQIFAIGIAMATPLIGITKLYSDMGAELARASLKTGVGVEALSGLKYAAEQSGAGLDDLVKGIKFMSREIVAAAKGTKSAQEALDYFGISLEDLSRMSPEDQFRAIATGISKIESPTVRAALGMQFFGRNASQLMPLIDLGAEGIDKFVNHAKELGVVMSTQDAAAALDFTQRMNDVWQVLRMAGVVAGSILAPALRTIALTLTSGINVIRDFTEQHRKAASVVGAAIVGLTVVFIAGGAAMLIFGQSLKFVSAAFGTLSAVFSMAQGAIGVVTGFIGSLATSFMALSRVVGVLLNPFKLLGTVLTAIPAMLAATASGILALLSPAVVATAAILALAGVFVYLSQVSNGVGAFLSGVWEDVKRDTIEAFTGIKDAISSGDWATAGKILWTYLKIEFERGKAIVSEIWLNLTGFMIGEWNNLTSDLETAWSYFKEYLSNWDGVKTAIMKIGEWIKDIFQNTINYVSDLLQDLFMTTSKKQLKVELANIDKRESSGQLTKEQADKARAIAESDAGSYDSKARSSRNKELEDAYNAKQQALNADYAKKHPDLVDTEEAERSRIEADRLAKKKDIEEQIAKLKSDSAADHQKEIDSLKAQMHGLDQKAAEGRAARGDFVPPTFDPDAAENAMKELTKSGSAGTFHGSALGGLAGGSAADKIVKNTQETAQFLGDIKEVITIMRNNPWKGILFG